jgi:hypothetical protein
MMESTGEKNKIQISFETSTLLANAGKSNWFVPRQEVVQDNLNGTIATYWLRVANSSHDDARSQHSNEKNISIVPDTIIGLAFPADPDAPNVELRQANDKILRLIDWNLDVLMRVLQQIAVRRNTARRRCSTDTIISTAFRSKDEEDDSQPRNGTVLEQVAEIIHLPKFDREVILREKGVDSIEVPPEVEEQLRSYLSRIASMYRSNPCKLRYLSLQINTIVTTWTNIS